MRVANLPTAIADSVAGALIVSHATVSWPTLLKLALVSAAAYAAGCVFNDIADINRDRRFRPERPLAAGRISVRGAFLLGVILLVLAAQLGYSLEPLTALITTALLASALLYDGAFKHLALVSALGMGLPRALNLLLGLSVLGMIPRQFLLFPAFLFSYVVLLTLLSDEEESRDRWAARLVLLLLLGLLGLVGTVLGHARVWILLGAAGLWIGAHWLSFEQARRPLRSVVGATVLSIPLLDAAFVASEVGFSSALPLVLLSLVGWLLARRMPVS